MKVKINQDTGYPISRIEASWAGETNIRPIVVERLAPFNRTQTHLLRSDSNNLSVCGLYKSRHPHVFFTRVKSEVTCLTCKNKIEESERNNSPKTKRYLRGHIRNQTNLDSVL